jgi:glycosyltransferase involved in cell wall biosynthesis
VPDITFVIPAHNEEKLLEATLRAIRSAAEGIGRPLEIIVVDDASTDRTAHIAATSGARVQSVNLRKISAVRNAGAKIAQGDTLIFVDADTLVTQAVLNAALAAIEQGAVGGGSRIQLDDQAPRWGQIFTWLITTVMIRLGLAAGCFVFARRAAFEAAGGFDEQYFATEELHLSQALKRQGRFVIVREAVVTSGRKFHAYSAWYIFTMVIRVLAGGGFRQARKREGLELWYDAPR